MKTEAAVLWEYGSEGDHVVLSFIPACGDCAWCASGHQNLCDQAADLRAGLQRDGTSRHHVKGRDARLMCLLGTFSPYTVCRESSVIRIDDDIPLEDIRAHRNVRGMIRYP